MRISCLGGGPAGLFLALLACRAGHEVDVFERAPQGAAAGFGVVFSRMSLARLRGAASDVVDEIAAAATHWDEIEVRTGRGEASSGGHGFAAIERRVLLDILEGHVVRAGARLRHAAASDVRSRLGAGADLVVASDGASSRNRPVGVAALPSEVDRTWYAWFASDRITDSMTFAFREGTHGPMSAHIYPYAADRCTFLVELPAAAWRAAGLVDGHTRPVDWSDPAAHELVTATFAPDLRGAGLYANGSRWLRFRDVVTTSWVSGRVVAVGDAAHTAHYSLGSGTTLAFDDARELAARLDPARGFAGDVDAALRAYERSRRPVVADVQDAARASRKLWEQPDPDTGADTMLLRLLTRTGRLSLRQAARLDRSLVERIDLPVTAPCDVPRVGRWTASEGGPTPDTQVALLDVGTAPHHLPREVHTWLHRVDAGALAESSVGGPTPDSALAARLAGARRAAPLARHGLAVSVDGIAPGDVETRARRVLELARRHQVTVVAVVPGTAGAAAERSTRATLGEALHDGMSQAVGNGVVAHAVEPRELEYGWTHVASGRADEVWVGDC